MAPPRSRKKGTAVKMQDVANECGVSLATVSVVLNGAPLARYIAAGTKERIKKAAKALGYRPNAMARSLRSNRSHAVGVMFFDITDPFCTPILRGIETTLYQSSYVPIVTDAHNQSERFERYLEMMLERQVEGLIIVANWLFVDIHLLGDLANREIPTVVVGWEGDAKTVSSVMVDNTVGVNLALAHLHELGHRSIAFIRGPKSILDSRQRWSAIEAFAQTSGLQIDPDLVVDLPDQFDPQLGFDNACRLTEELLNRKKRFTALVTFDDFTAFGAVRALKKAGVRVPEDCSVVGFDDIAPAGLLTPGLTTVSQPLEQMGHMAAAIVRDGIAATVAKQATSVSHHRLPPKLTIRESTAPAR